MSVLSGPWFVQESWLKSTAFLCFYFVCLDTGSIGPKLQFYGNTVCVIRWIVWKAWEGLEKSLYCLSLSLLIPKWIPRITSLVQNYTSGNNQGKTWIQIILLQILCLAHHTTQTSRSLWSQKPTPAGSVF